MFRSMVLVSIMIVTTMAVDFRLGKGSYETNMQIKNFLNHETTNDTWMFVVDEAHKAFSQHPLFYYYELELLTSNKKNQQTEFANFAASHSFPLVGSLNDMTNSFIGMFPVDGSYQALGFDMNFGLGYDLWRKKESYFGVALNLGATLPTINAENLSTKVSLTYDLIQKWDLDVTTYKVGPMVKGAIALSPQWSLYGTFSYGFQTAVVESGLFKSSIDVDGSYQGVNIGTSYKVAKSPWSISCGYSYKKWEVDSAVVNLYHFFQADVLRPFTLSFKSSYGYVGIGYRF